MRNPIILVFLALLAAAILYPIATRPSGVAPPASPPSAPLLCQDGQTRACTAGSCSGVSTCVGGVWSGCKWARVCTPGSKVSCIQNGCAYAFRVCDECGSAYGPCITPSP